MQHLNTVITGMGSYIPTKKVTNEDFKKHSFFDETGKRLDNTIDVILQKFVEITGIEERRYAPDNMVLSDIASIAAQRAIDNAKIDAETIDQIIVAHNYGDVEHNTIQSDMVPSIATRIKHNLKIKNPSCVAYDILFGCPGWVQAVIQAHAYIKAGMGKRFLVVGAETLSRVSDRHDRDSMIYADGAGAAIIEAEESENQRGLLSYSMQTDAQEQAYYLFAGNSYNPEANQDVKYIKMLGRKIYEYALTNVPQAMKLAMERAGEKIEDLKKILIHQANEKMDEAIVKRFYRLYKQKMPENIMPMSIQKLGNSSVATIPTLFDLLLKKDSEPHVFKAGDILMFASVGAGMNINSFVYKY